MKLDALAHRGGGRAHAQHQKRRQPMFRKVLSFGGMLLLAGAAVFMTPGSGLAQRSGGHGGGFHGGGFHGGGSHSGGFRGGSFHGGSFHGGSFHDRGFHGHGF